jgi:hypothetical protein
MKNESSVNLDSATKNLFINSGFQLKESLVTNQFNDNNSTIAKDI